MLSHLILFHSISLFYFILFYPILSYPILSYPILSYLILSYLILFYFHFGSFSPVDSIWIIGGGIAKTSIVEALQCLKCMYHNDLIFWEVVVASEEVDLEYTDLELAADASVVDEGFTWDQLLADDEDMY